MLRCGLLGEKLGHSYSPQIHARLADYEYRLYECPRERLGDFLQNGAWDGLNVTIPYKKAVIDYCAELSETAKKLGSVNTLVRRSDGSIYGDNTDAYGFSGMVKRSGVAAEGKKALVLGSGGACATVCEILRTFGAREIVVISRSGENNYRNLDRHKDAALIVNTTPVGMYPNNGASPVDLRAFPACEGVLDLIYNPARTALILQAEALHIPHASGLYMLVAQAKRSSELFTGGTIDDREIERIEKEIAQTLQNVVLIGMPGCGKSTLAAALGKALGRSVYESDALIAEKAGMSVPEIFSRYGEEAFRKLETEVLGELGKLSGVIISTGGGCVLREENYASLHQNGRIFWLWRELDRLATNGRPLSLKTPVHELYAQRRAFYERFADVQIDNNGSMNRTVEAVREELQ